ncbi:unnamed protein product [Choristocarpus tenellus]
METDFINRREFNFSLESDLIITAVGAPVPLLRNPPGYISRRRSSRSRWQTPGYPTWEVTSRFLRDHNSVLIPANMLHELVHEDSLLQGRVCKSDGLYPNSAIPSWQGSSLEHLQAGSPRPWNSPPLLTYAAGHETSEMHLRSLQPWWKVPNGGCHSEEMDGKGGYKADRLPLYSGPVRQLAAARPLPGCLPNVFARCDYSATLIEVRHGARSDEATERSTDSKNHLRPLERLEFGHCIASVACSPHTHSHAAFLDEDCRLFEWNAGRGTTMYGHGPLPVPGVEYERSDAGKGSGCGGRSKVAAGGSTTGGNKTITFGHHPRTVWVVAGGSAFRIDLRRASPRGHGALGRLDMTLEPLPYYRPQTRAGDGGGIGPWSEVPMANALSVGQKTVHEVYVSLGMHLVCMDDRFPKGTVAR